MSTQERYVAVLDGEADLDLMWLERSLGPDAEVLALADANVRRVEQLIEAGTSGIVFVLINKDNAHARGQLIETLLERKPQLEVIALGPVDDVGLVLTAMRSGARDFLLLGCEAADLRAAVDSRFRKKPRQDSAKMGTSYVILSPRPDTATSVFATHLSLALTEGAQGPRDTLLVDLGVPDADSLLFLDIKPSYLFDDALRSVRRFDETLIRTAFARHPSGLAVLPRSDGNSPIQHGDEQDAVALLGVLRNYFETVVVNLAGTRRVDALRGLITDDSQVLLLLDQSVVTCRASRQLLDALADGGAPVDSIRLIVDRYTDKLSPDAGRISEVLGLPIFATLPASGLQKVTAMNTGRSIFELDPKCAYSRSIRDLVAELEPGERAAENGKSMRERYGDLVRRVTGR